MSNEEFAVWCVKDAAQQVSKGLLIYVVLLGLYWLTIG
jgi:hypothetical protein